MGGKRRTHPFVAYTRAEMGSPIPGVFLIRPHASFIGIIDAVELLAECGEEKEFGNQVGYLPM